MDPATLIDQLTTYEDLPVEAIVEATEHRTEMAPLLCGLIEAFLAAEGPREDDDNRIFLAVHLLGGWREPSAYRPMARLLMSDKERLNRALGEAITETVPGIMLNLFDGDPRPLRDVIACETADEMARSGMLQVLATLTERGDLAKSETAAYLRDLHDRLRPRAESHVWIGWATSIALLGLTDLVELVTTARDRGWIDGDLYDEEVFLGELDLHNNDPTHAAPSLTRVLPFDDTVKTLAEWVSISGEHLAHDWDAIGDDLGDRMLDEDGLDPDADLAPLDEPLEPVTNPYRHVGRNDPCPCGSGKKFKKCCLGKVA
jgi:hypothetical protein